MNKPTAVIITGASSGIGRALALRYLENGDAVGVCGRNEAKLREIYKDYARATPLAFGVTDRAAFNINGSTSPFPGALRF